MEITGKTRLVGIIGYPLTYTVSPQIHNAAFDAVGLDIRYVPVVVDPADLGDAVAGLKALGFLGINVTMPHKEAIIEWLDEVDAEARLVGAVNTVAIKNGRTVGYNTDGRGFLTALAAEGFDPKGARAVVVGAGGAARAIVSTLARSAVEISVANRTFDRAEELVSNIGSRHPDCRIKALEFDGEFADRISDAELIVNATSIGMDKSVDETPVRIDWLHEGQLVFDLVYRPARTRLMRDAVSRGAKTIGGLPMLVYQAAASFEIWTGIPAPPGAMEDAARRALEK